MTKLKAHKRLLGAGLAAIAVAMAPVGFAAPAAAQSGAVQPSETLNISANTGTLVQLPGSMSDLFVANPGIADVQVRSNRQLYIFGKAAGETTIYATGPSGNVVYAANVRVGNNVGSVAEMLRLAMPEANIQATPMNNLMLLTGTVADPDDAEEAERLVQAYVGEGTQVVSRLQMATPLQVLLKVRIAEINRTMLKSMGMNLDVDDPTGGDFIFGIGQGSAELTGGVGNVVRSPIGTTFSGLTSLFGLDILGSLDLAETDGLVTTLAEPNLSALSGETASFLAGGEFPIPVSQSLGNVAIEYKEYGVGLAFTPYVLADGRISMRVAPEVSELSTEGSIRLNGFDVPALTTRRAETTVEMGSGQSFMIAGLLRNTGTNNIEKAPFLGDIPIIGSLFRSTSYRRNETELVIVVTPYLVKPVSTQLATPVDGYRAPYDADRYLLGSTYDGTNQPSANGNAVVNEAPASPGVSSDAGAAQPGFSM
ncbi:type II and III secretion system protein family protein [Sphingomicrobium clamense]|uniref:Type II and III secretion system protein family protein n=1 Tax=Sphingomicrobium clamense TaxID=2851013 RepID=A0ABS6V657_9SPHN|nr:type II and III secretion system protein family protein [Sphingomicrobium sp. B8]MBW0144830.1 type II and III secretion system protein family protein [Sphingomicrobium sp. B8]